MHAISMLNPIYISQYKINPSVRVTLQIGSFLWLPLPEITKCTGVMFLPTTTRPMYCWLGGTDADYLQAMLNHSGHVPLFQTTET